MPLMFYRGGDSLGDLDKYLGPNGESRFVEVGRRVLQGAGSAESRHLTANPAGRIAPPIKPGCTQAMDICSTYCMHGCVTTDVRARIGVWDRTPPPTPSVSRLDNWATVRTFAPFPPALPSHPVAGAHSRAVYEQYQQPGTRHAGCLALEACSKQEGGGGHPARGHPREDPRASRRSRAASGPLSPGC